MPTSSTLRWRHQGIGRIKALFEHGYNITPFGVVGADECFDHAMERDELMDTRFGKLLSDRGVRPDMIPPIPKGVFSTLIPKPQHTYIAFGEPVVVPDHSGKNSVPKRC